MILGVIAILCSGYGAWTARSAEAEVVALRQEIADAPSDGLGGALGGLMQRAVNGVRDAPVRPGGGGKAKGGKVKGGKAKGGKAKGGKAKGGKVRGGDVGERDPAGRHKVKGGKRR
jgi:hypothetical protein